MTILPDTGGAATVRAVERISLILEVVAERQGGVRLTELAAAIGLPAATCHRLLGGLEQTGMLRRDSQTRRWQAGDRLARIATGVQPNPGLSPIVTQATVALAEQWNLGAYVATLSNGDCVCVATVRAWRSNGPALGSIRPLCEAAPALAILAALGRPVARALVAHATGSTVADALGPLELELERIRRRGFAATFQIGSNTAECATTFIGPPGEPPRALTLCGTPSRMRSALRGGLPWALSDAARSIERQSAIRAAHA